MGKRPTVSVIIPTYNREHLIGRSIESVLSQTYKDFEIIVVDDGSTDNTKNIIERKFGSKVNYVYQARRGGSAARNTGIRAARGEYISFLDDDDEWIPEKLMKQMGAIRASGDDVGVIYSACDFMSGTSNSVLDQTVPIYRGDVHELLLRRNIFPFVTAIMRRSCFEKAGVFDERLPSCQDWDLWIRISRHFSFDFVPESLAKTYIHGDQISTDVKKRILGREMLMRKYYKDLISRPAILASHLKRIGILSILSDERKKGIKSFLKSLRVDPTQKSCYAYILLSLLRPKPLRKYLLNRHTSIFEEFTLFY